MHSNRRKTITDKLASVGTRTIEEAAPPMAPAAWMEYKI